MAASNSEVASPVVPTTFSYAQAAKGKPTPSAPSPSQQSPSPSMQAKDVPASSGAVTDPKTTWADDATDARTVVDESAHHEGTNGTMSQPEVKEVSTETQVEDHESHDSPHFGGSSTSTAHEDDAVSQPNGHSEVQWEHKSQSSQTADSPSVTSEDQNRKSKTKDKKNAKPTPESYKDAPPPSINFWAQRATDAKKQPPSSLFPMKSNSLSGTLSSSAPREESSALLANGSAKPSQTEPADFAGTSPSRTQNHIRNRSEGAALRQARASNDTRLPPRKLHASSAATPPSLVNDAMSWPTPETAQSKEEQERKKPSEKTEKSEGDRSVAKPHGKNEWVPVPFTPSVKFNTPMPITGRSRGGRGSGNRGGRGGIGANGGERAARASAGDTAADSAERGRSDSSAARSSSVPAKAKRPTSNSQAPADQDASQSSQFKRASTQGEWTSSRSGNAVLKQGPDEDSSTAALQSDRGSIPSGVDSIEARSRKVAAGQPEVAEDGSSRSQHKWKSSRSADAGNLTLDTSEEGRRDNVEVGATPVKAYGSRKNDGAHRDSGSVHRGEGRRARGGRGNLLNSHAQMVNGHSSASPVVPPHSAKSGSFQSHFQQPYSPYATNPRFRPSPRSTSIPNGFFPGYQYAPGPYDYDLANMYASSPAAQLGSNVELMMLSNGVASQLNYYFSLDNLLKDMFLRKHMDSQGFVSLTLIGEFKRMKQLTTSVELLRAVCLQSPSFELRTGSDGKERVRVKEGWEKWVLPMEERDAAAQNEGPSAPEKQQNGSARSGEGLYSARSPMSPPLPSDGFHGHQFNGLSTPFTPISKTSSVGSHSVGNKQSNRYSLSAIGPEFYNHRQPLQSPTNGSKKSNESEDVFSDAQIDHLIVVLRDENQSRPPLHNESSRTFSHGSLDGDALIQEASKAEEPSSQTSNGVDEREHNEKLSELRKTLTSSSTTSKGAKAADTVGLYWIKGKESPGPMPSDSAGEPYKHVHARAIQQRQLAAEGECPYDMNLLYQFWSHFLVRNFNASMYNEFRQLSHEDASINATRVGMNNLIKYYGGNLASRTVIRDQVLGHYLELVRNEDPGKERPAFKQLRTAWRDGSLNFRNRKKLIDALDSDLKAHLEQ